MILLLCVVKILTIHHLLNPCPYKLPLSNNPNSCPPTLSSSHPPILPLSHPPMQPYHTLTPSLPLCQLHILPTLPPCILAPSYFLILLTYKLLTSHILHLPHSAPPTLPTSHHPIVSHKHTFILSNLLFPNPHPHPLPLPQSHSPTLPLTYYTTSQPPIHSLFYYLP